MSSLTQRYESSNDVDGLWPNDDELGRLVRWSLCSSMGSAEPSPEVWSTILDRVREQPRPGSAERTSRSSSAPLTAVVQAAVIGCVLMTLGLGVRRDVIVAHNSLSAAAAPLAEMPLVIGPMRAAVPSGAALSRVDEGRPFRVGGNIMEATLSS